MRQLLFYDVPVRKHKTRKLAQYKQRLESKEKKTGKGASATVWARQMAGGIQPLGRNSRDAHVKSVLYLMELVKILIR